MFKSIEYKLIVYLILLIGSIAAATLLFTKGLFVYAVVAIVVAVFSLVKLAAHYKKFNKNILFLLNAMENGDYSFHFSTTKLSLREKELNSMLNHIKAIIIKSRNEAIENERFLSIIIENIPTGIIILNDRDGVQTVNEAAMRLLGLNVLTNIKQLKRIDESLADVFTNLTPQKRAQIKIADEREERQISVNVSRIILKSGTLRVYTLNNIGNELETKEMESWVRLIRVMTHEIMNSIAPITSLSDTMLFAYRENAAEVPDAALSRNTVEAFETITATAKGLVSFVESYRKFTGIPKPEMREFRLAPLLDKVINLKSHNPNEKNIGIEVIPADNNYKLTADEGQITQVLVNLIKNAAEAIGSSPDGSSPAGKIIVKIKEENQKLQIDVCNNGKPIPPDVAPNIFIPFFTTKEFGTGIGLSISRYIMRLHGGNLKHHTSNGWTVFSMVF